MQHFIGTYECKADAKGRIMIPVALKKQLSAVVSKGFVLKRAVFNSALSLPDAGVGAVDVQDQ